MKKLLLLCAVVLSFLLCTGCHGSKVDRESFEVPDSFDVSKNYEVVFWAKNENNATQRAAYEKAISEFEGLYPNIKVTIKHYVDYGEIYNDVITNIQTDTTPNIAITYPDHIATYITGEQVVVPLNELMVDEKYGFGGSEVKFDSPTGDEIIKKFLDECYIGDTLYGLPFMRSTEACYVNKTYVEALGYELPEVLTWDFVWKVSKSATEKNSDGTYKINGQKVMIPFIYKSTDNMMIQMLRQRDAGYSTAGGRVEIFNSDTREILLNISKNTKYGSFSTFKISSYPGNFLNKGQCIFAIDSTAGSTWMGAEAPLIDVPEDALIDFELAVLPVPQYDTDNPQMISQGPSLCIFNKDDSGEVMASWLFAQYLLSNETQISYSQTEGYVPVTTKAQNSPEFQDYLSRAGEDNDLYYEVKIETIKMLMSNVDNTFVTPVFNGSTSLRNAAGQMIENVTKDTRRKKTVNDAYIDKLFEDMVKLYRLDQIESSDVRENFGELPKLSKGLLFGVGALWVGIGVYVSVPLVCKKIKKKR